MNRTRGSIFVIVLLLLLPPAAAAEEGAPSGNLAELMLPAQAPIPLKVKSSARCMFGDFDLIASDLGGSRRTASLIITLESLEDRSAKPYAIASLFGPGIGANIISKNGYDLDLQPHSTLAPQLLGLYICRDAADTRRCGDKPFLPFRQAIAVHSSSQPISQVNVNDKVYFFTFLVAAGDKLYFSDQLFDDDALARLPAQIRGLLKKAAAPAVLTSLTNAARTVAAEPLSLQDGRLTIDLPRVEVTRCGQGKPANN